MRTVDRFNQRSQKIYNGQDVLKNHFLLRYPILFTNEPENYDQIKKYADQHDFVWIVDSSIETLRSFPWHFKPTKDLDAAHLFPYVYKKSKRPKTWTAVQLVPTNYDSTKTATHPHICGIYDVYKGKDRFDIFFIGTPNKTYNKLLKKYKDVKLVSSHEEARSQSETDMFWLIPDDVTVKNTFNFSFEPDEWSFKYTHVFGNGDSKTQDGIALFPNNYKPTEKELTHRFYANKKEIKIVASDPISYEKKNLKSYNDYLEALKDSKTEMFWGIPDDVNLEKSFDFSLYFDHHNQYDRSINHVFLNDKTYDGVVLYSKKSPITKKEFDHRFIANKKEWDIVASKPKPYDKFIVNCYEDYLEAKSKSKTEMFWGVPDDVTVKRNLDLYFDHHNRYDRNITHVFLNDKTYDGVVLYSKNIDLTKREVETRFYANKKEHDEVYSVPKPYDYYEIDSYEDYLKAVENSEIFWMSSANISVDQNLINSFYISHHNIIDRSQNHAFIHRANDLEIYNGVFLCSKHKPLTEKEVEYRYPVERKEWSIIGSTSKPYDRFEIDSYDEYLSALENSSTEMFWMTSRNITADIPEIYFDHSNTYDRTQNHVFVHRVGEQNLYNGVFLCSKHKPLTEKEVTYRHLIDRKEWDIVASVPILYNRFKIDSFDEYLKALENSITEMFWGIPSDVIVNEKFNFDLYFTHDNEYDRNINHVMLNGKYRDGIVLFSKTSPVTKKEIETRFIVNKKDWDIVASDPKTYDRFVIDNYDDYNKAKEQTSTEMFWMIPPEVNVKDDFMFDLYFDHHNQYDRNINHIFKNGKAYDGVSLLSKNKTVSEKEIDMRFFAEKKSYEIVASNPTLYDIVFISSDEKYADENYAVLTKRFPQAKRISNIKGIHQAHIAAAKLCTTDMFWVVDGDAEIIDNFHFDYYVPRYDPDSKKTVHVWKAVNPINNLIYGYGAVKLLPRQMTIDMNTDNSDMTTSISPLFKSVNRVSNTTRFNTDEFTTWRSAFRECVKLSSKTIKGQLDEETEFRLFAWCTRGKDKEFGEACIAGANAGKAYGTENADNTAALKMINDFEWLEQQFKQSYQST